MEKMPILVLLLYSIPESIILISLSAALYGYKVKENFYRIVLLGISLALITYIVRAIPNIKVGLNVIIEFPLFVLLTSRYLKISLIRGFFFILTGFIIIALTENIFVPLFSLVFHLSPKKIFDNVFWLIFMGWTFLSLLAAITIILQKKKISLVNVAAFFQPKTRSGKLTLVLIGLVLVQAFLSISLNLTFYYKTSKVWRSFDTAIIERIISLVLFSVPLISIFLVKRLFSLSEQEIIAETQEAFIDNINKLFTTIRGQRHDFINHVQVIYSMLNTNQIQEAIKYMDNLLDEIQSISNLIKVKDPVLSALFNTKKAIADRHNINLEIKLESPIDTLKLKPYETVKILGNLIDNALEAVETQPAEFRQVKVNLKKFSFVFVFEVFNPRPIIDHSNITKIFEPGYSTKENHSGLGLAVVKDLVDRNGGEITVKSTEEEGTVFTVIIPLK